jgi:hypothetical protein
MQQAGVSTNGQEVSANTPLLGSQHARRRTLLEEGAPANRRTEGGGGGVHDQVGFEGVDDDQLASFCHEVVELGLATLHEHTRQGRFGLRVLGAEPSACVSYHAAGRRTPRYAGPIGDHASAGSCGLESPGADRRVG